MSQKGVMYGKFTTNAWSFTYTPAGSQDNFTITSSIEISFWDRNLD